MSLKRRAFFTSIFFISIGLLFAGKPGVSVNAQSQQDESTHSCKDCHEISGLTAQLADGSSVDLSISASEFNQAAHPSFKASCESCHLNHQDNQHPNPEFTSCQKCHPNGDYAETLDISTLIFTLSDADRRTLSLRLISVCVDCHQEEFVKVADSTHQRVFNQGNHEAPICTDCHGSHTINPPSTPRSQVSTTCSTCHYAVYSTYKQSIHGEALLDEGNPDVPTCIDCHGVHNISGPYDITFRSESILMCTTCHDDDEKMAPYAISTNVSETYLSTFHGKSANLFKFTNHTRPVDTAVCYDCHGIHNILKPDDPNSQVYPENIMGTCQKCHEDAAMVFPQEWLGHYSPNFKETPVLYILNVFYPIAIGLMVTIMLLYIFYDLRRTWKTSKRITKGPKHG